jgi:predicted O-linked N-acetylglucosamine transferase (SPINDLY family)
MNINLGSSEVDHLMRQGLEYLQSGRRSQAKKSFQKVLKLNPKNADALHFLGCIAHESHNPRRAVEIISKAVKLAPGNAHAHYNLANALKELNRFNAAVLSYEKAIELDKSFIGAYYNCANTYYELSRFSEAIEKYQKAILLKENFHEAHFNKGNALKELQQYEAAIASYDKAIALNGKFADAYINKGSALHHLREYEAAIACYQKAISVGANSVEVYSNQGNSLMNLNRYPEAIESFAQAIAIKDDYQCVYGNRLYSKLKICDWSDLDNQIEKVLKEIRIGNRIIGPFETLAITSDPGMQKKSAEIWNRDEYKAIQHNHAKLKKLRKDKIYLGYFSADFHNHATTYLMAKLFELHDRSRFKIFAFSFGPKADDEMRCRVTETFDEFIDVNSHTDKEVADLSRKMEIDIAIDLKGYTRDSRPGIFEYRAAPVQVNYLGYPGTMGSKQMDYIVADKVLIPESHRHYYAEKIVYMPNTYQVNDSSRAISNKEFRREELGLPDDGFVYCCFNNNYKIIPETFETWMRILNNVEKSVLWLFAGSPEAAENLGSEAQKRGVDPDRLVFASKMPLADHLARHRAADLFLDTLPYNAHTTASDALWAGLPVLTCTGDSFASRVAASLLFAIGLNGLVTDSLQRYEDLAVEIGQNPDLLKRIKAKLESHRLAFPLFDTQLFTRKIENAYSQMYGRYHSGQNLEHIFVED